MSDTSWPAFAGIDWGGEQQQLCVVDNAGKRLTQLRVDHDVVYELGAAQRVVRS